MKSDDRKAAITAYLEKTANTVIAQTQSVGCIILIEEEGSIGAMSVHGLAPRQAMDLLCFGIAQEYGTRSDDDDDDDDTQWAD